MSFNWLDCSEPQQPFPGTEKETSGLRGTTTHSPSKASHMQLSQMQILIYPLCFCSEGRQEKGSLGLVKG